MDQFNLLDLNNDVLIIIGDYVKQDNNIREFNELTKKEIFDEADKLFKRLNKNMNILTINQLKEEYFFFNM